MDSMVSKVVPSISATCGYKGQIIFSHGSGKINPEEKDSPPPDENTIYRIGSVTKVFPVLQLYQQVNQGIYSLDDTLKNISFLNKLEEGN